MSELWQHQKGAVAKAREYPSLALFFDVGTGKSRTLIQILREDFTNNKGIRNTLIFAPVSVCPGWVNEFSKYSRVPLEQIHVLLGEGKKRTAALNKILESGKKAIVICNYEAVQVEAFYDALKKFAPEIIIADESHKIKDSSSKRAKKIYALSDKAARKFALTGTPMPNGMLDIFGQMRFLDPSIFGTNYFIFRLTYFYDKNAGMPSHVHFPDWQPRKEAAEDLAAKIADISCQAKKSECLDLPPLVKQDILVDMAPKQAKAYETMLKEFVSEVNGQVVTAEFAMTKTLRLQQILCGFLPTEQSDAEWFDDSQKLKALEETLESIGKNKTIVWTTFKPTYKKIARVCEKLNLKYVMLTGEQSATEKAASIEAFQNGDADVLIANPAAGGAGVNLQAASYSVYFNRSYNAAEFEQSEARNYRGGSEIHSRITHYYLIVKNTVDEVIGNALSKKISVSAEVLKWARIKGETNGN